MSTLQEPVPAATEPVPSVEVPQGPRPLASWLAPVLVVCCLLGVGGLSYLAARAAAYAQEVRGWERTVGAVVAHPFDDQRGPGVVFYDVHGRRRVYLLAPNDTDDIPPGSLGYVAYQAHGNRMELQGVPGDKERALISLAGLFAGGAAAAGLWWYVDARARARVDEPDERESVAA